MKLLNEARQYAAIGWSVLPVTHTPRPKSVPLKSWSQYQTVKPDDATLRRWFARDRDGLAVVCGPVSGGLVVRDFDSLAAYDRWRASHPDLAKTLPTVATSRGRHVYIRSDFDGIREVTREGVPEGELRGKGICILPPSTHPSGTAYRWLVPARKDIPLLDPVAVGLVPEDAAWDTRGTQEGHRKDSGGLRRTQ